MFNSLTFNRIIGFEITTSVGRNGKQIPCHAPTLLTSLLRMNQRTGRRRLDDPNPPVPQTYLENRFFETHIRRVERIPDSQDPLYRRVMNAMLRPLFPTSEGYDVNQEEFLPNNGRAD